MGLSKALSTRSRKGFPKTASGPAAAAFTAVPTPRGHLGLRVSVMSFVSQPSKRGWDKSLPLGIVPALDSLVNRVDRTPRNTSNLSNTQEGDHQVLLTKKSIRIQGLF